MVLAALVLLGAVCAAGLIGFVYYKETHLPPVGEFDTIIVLGAQVKADGTPSVALERRLTAALEEYRKLCRENPKIRAIGEIGLDYHYEDVPRDRQQAAFRAQMGLARELGLPVIVHEREAHEDGIRIVEEFPEVTGVFHCYSGSAEMAKWLIGRGWYIGFTGVLTFKNARRALEAAAAVPRDRVVIETDCPYMSPEPFRGKRNDPTRLYRMAEALASLWSVSPEEAQAITFENGKRLYGI